MMQLIQEFICKSYSKLGEIDSITGVQAHEINSRNYILQCGISKNKYICKILEKDTRIKTILEILEYCLSKKQKVSKVVLSDQGNSLIEFGNRIFCILHYEEGNIFTGDIKEIKSFASNLASLHLTLENYHGDVPRVKKHKYYEHLTEEEFRNIGEEISQNSNNSSFDELVLGKMDFMVDCFKENKNYFLELDNQTFKKQTIHGDLNVMNVLFLNNKLQIFLDFNHAHNDDRIREVAFACMRFALHNTNDEDIIERRIRTFIEEYEISNPLSCLEKRSLDQYYINECLKRISYIIKSNYFYDDSKWNFDLKKHIDNISKTICSKTC